MMTDRMTTQPAGRAGPRMKQAARFVAEHPGCSIKRVAEHLVDSRVHPDRSLSGGYAVVHRAIAAGLIIARRGPGWRAKYELTASTSGALSNPCNEYVNSPGGLCTLPPSTPGTLPPATPATPATPSTPATPDVEWEQYKRLRAKFAKFEGR